jgi:hypothetical protein
MPAWGSVGQERLPAGWAYPVDREHVDAALTTAGVRVGTLAFAVPDPAALGEPMVLDVRWLPAAGSAVVSRRAPSERLVLRFWAAPVADVALLAAQLEGGWLARSCRWAAAALTRDDAIGHRLVVTSAAGTLHALEG